MIDGIKGGIPGLPTIPGLDQVTKPEAQNKGGSFADALKEALNEVDRLQGDADSKIQGLTLGDKKVTPHDAMIALEKADVAFQLMTTIKAKIVRAYEEVIRTQV